MKNQYTIHEIANLYGIGTDSLRYYEKLGLISPKRGENGYRLYNLGDIYRLTIIRDLRQLNFNMEQIGDYLNDLNVQNTMNLFESEKRLILKRQKELKDIEKSIKIRMTNIENYKNIKIDEMTRITLEDRFCVRLNTNIQRDEEFDFAIKKLHHMHNKTIRDLGRHTMGASIATADIDEKVYNQFCSVFFVLPQDSQQYDFVLPSGEYVHVFYKGSYVQSPNYIRKLRAWINENGWKEDSEILELYHIDNRYTEKEEEFITEIQVKVKKNL